MVLGHASSQQIEMLRSIRIQHGIDAFDDAAREQFFALTAIIAHVLGPQRLRDLLETAAELHQIQG